MMRSQIHTAITVEYGITTTQFHTLRRIKTGNASVTELAEEMHVSCPSVSRTVDELAESGLIERIRNANDRRVLLLKLTPKGEQLFEDMHAKHDQILENQFSNLEEDELEKLGDALQILQKIVEENT